MRLPNVKMLLCWSSRMQIYGFVENHTFLEQFVSMGGTSAMLSTLHGSLWLGKDKGSIMKSAGSCGTIYYKHYDGNKLFE